RGAGAGGKTCDFSWRFWGQPTGAVRRLGTDRLNRTDASPHARTPGGAGRRTAVRGEWESEGDSGGGNPSLLFPNRIVAPGRRDASKKMGTDRFFVLSFLTCRSGARRLSPVQWGV